MGNRKKAVLEWVASVEVEEEIFSRAVRSDRAGQRWSRPCEVSRVVVASVGKRQNFKDGLRRALWTGVTGHREQLQTAKGQK